MGGQKKPMLEQIATYYSRKLAEYGQSPLGVDWNGEESQVLRFKQLSKIIDPSNEFSVNDLGCGYGAYFDYLQREYNQVRYRGIDLSAEMISAAKLRFEDDERARFVVAGHPDVVADYGIASGIFNVRLASADDAWRSHVVQTLDALDKTSRRGFSFNCLTSYSDRDKMRDYLHYADPCELFDHCKRAYSRNVALLHDYGLYEFTILVRKS